MVATTFTIAHINRDTGNFGEDWAYFGKWPW